MPYRYYEATHYELDPKLGEYACLKWALEIPVVGEMAQMGSDRIWEVVAVDNYRLAEQTQPEFEADSVIYLNHCGLQNEILPERRSWTRVEMFQEQPLTILQLFVSPEQNLIQSSINFYGNKVRVGFYLRQYDYERRQFIKLPWRVSRIDSYLPSPEHNPYYCYAAIYMAHCVQVPQTEFNYKSGEIYTPVVSR